MPEIDVVLVFCDIKLCYCAFIFGPFDVMRCHRLQGQACPSVCGHHNTSKLQETNCPRTERIGTRNLRLQGIKYLYAYCIVSVTPNFPLTIRKVQLLLSVLL